MRFRESHSAVGHSNILLFIAGLIFLSFGLFADPVEILKTVGFPVSKLYGERGRADLVSVRILTVVVSIALITSQIILWKNPRVVSKIARATNGFISAAAKLPLFTTLFLGGVVLVKTVLELSLYLIGYRAYSGDDFGRALKSYQWLQAIDKGFDLTTWLNLGTPQLPFPDYLFGLALALYRDVYITPKVMNLFLSSIVVIVAYLLGREIFGRTAGLFAAILCAFQPWIIWLGLSGMTSDLPSVIMIALFGLFLFRWLETNQTASLLAAAGCLFVAAGMRYENWFFVVVFSLFLVYRFISDARMGRLTRQAATIIVSALVIGNAFPIFHMAASYYLLGDLIPAMQGEQGWGYEFFWPQIMHTDSFKGSAGAPIIKINMVLWALTAFPLEIAAAVGGIALFLKSNGRKSPRVYLLIIVTTFLLFAAAFKGRLPVFSTGERFFVPYIILLLPFAGFLLVRLFQAYSLGQPLYAIFAALLLLTLGTFDITRAFNYPAKKYDRDAFAAGWTLRMLQGVGSISDGGQILIDKGRDEDPIPFPIVVLGNKPERFVSLVDGDVGKACYGGLGTQECKKRVFDGTFDMIILSSPEKVQAFQQIFSGRSWQIGNYQIFELNGSSKGNQTLARPIETTLINGSARSPKK
jgi:dolichyl-phosphate-mannose-protein mannosyltransferase